SALPARYLDSVRRAGGQPVVVDPEGADAETVVARVDALVLTGGPDVDPAYYGEAPHEKTYGVEPTHDEFEIALVRRAIDAQLPTLAICRGLQVLNVALGGTLYQHLPDDPGVAAHGKPGETGGELRHTVTVEPSSLLAQVTGATQLVASCHHHQAVG